MLNKNLFHFIQAASEKLLRTTFLETQQFFSKPPCFQNSLNKFLVYSL